MFRQAVISVRKYISPNVFDESAVDIVFRQPYNDLGLAMSFGFQKSYFVPFTQCNLLIHNNWSSLAENFMFDISDYTKRPLVEIRAGYTDYKIFDSNEVQTLKGFLPLIYTGFPYYLLDQKNIGGRSLMIQLNDLDASYVYGEKSRINISFPAGSSLLDDVIGSLVNQTGIKLGTTSFEDQKILRNKKTENIITYNNRLVMNDILPQLARQYGFYINLDNEGRISFRTSGILKTQKSVATVTHKNGLIEYPTKINWSHWQFKTLFAAPSFLYPGDWVDLKSNNFITDGISKSGKISGVITDGLYSFDDSTGMCTYTLAPEGVPVQANQVIAI